MFNWIPMNILRNTVFFLNKLLHKCFYKFLLNFNWHDYMVNKPYIYLSINHMAKKPYIYLSTNHMVNKPNIYLPINHMVNKPYIYLSIEWILVNKVHTQIAHFQLVGVCECACAWEFVCVRVCVFARACVSKCKRVGYVRSSYTKLVYIVEMWVCVYAVRARARARARVCVCVCVYECLLL